MKALLYRTDGTTEEITPANGTDFKLEECYTLLGVEMVEVVHCRDGSILICDEEGLLKQSPVVNYRASNRARMTIVGNVIHCADSMFR